MTVEPAAAVCQQPPPPTGSSPPGAPPDAPPFHGELLNQLARTATAEGQNQNQPSEASPHTDKGTSSPGASAREQAESGEEQAPLLLVNLAVPTSKAPVAVGAPNEPDASTSGANTSTARSASASASAALATAQTDAAVLSPKPAAPQTQAPDPHAPTNTPTVPQPPQQNSTGLLTQTATGSPTPGATPTTTTSPNPGTDKTLPTQNSTGTPAPSPDTDKALPTQNPTSTPAPDPGTDKPLPTQNSTSTPAPDPGTDKALPTQNPTSTPAPELETTTNPPAKPGALGTAGVLTASVSAQQDSKANPATVSFSTSSTTAAPQNAVAAGEGQQSAGHGHPEHRHDDLTARAGVDAATRSPDEPTQSSEIAGPTEVGASGAPAQSYSSAAGEQVARYGVGLEELIESVHATVEVAARQGMARARISLQPEALGDVRIHLSQTAEGLTARIVTQTQAAAQTLAQGHSQLRQSLSSLGVSLLRLDIGSSESQDPRAGERRSEQSESSPTPGRSVVETDSGESEIAPVQSTEVLRQAGGGLVDVLA